jgi:hypothetical protein
MATTLFIVSMLGICFLLGSKAFEIKVRKIHFLSNLFAKGDRKIHQLAESFMLRYARYKNISQIFLFDFLPSYVFELLTRMKDYVARKYYEAGDGFRGRRVLKNTGSVSFFLERLSEEEPNMSGREM